MELVAYIETDSDLAVIENVLRRLRVRFEKRNQQKRKPRLTNNRDNQLLELQQLAAKIEQSSFGDPIKWQREVREDRVMPFRGE